MRRFILDLIVVSLLGTVTVSLGNSVITSPPVTNLGVWGAWQYCPPGTYVEAFELKTEAWQGSLIDDTCLNGVALYCGDPYNATTTRITSTEGPWGRWGYAFRCDAGGYMNGFVMRVERVVALNDNTASNNMRFYCTNHGTGSYIVGDGEKYGDWGTVIQRCDQGQRVCGIQTQVQPNQGAALDDTALNNISFECCDVA